MQLDFQSEKPLFLQIADAITESILVGAFEEESQVPSTTEISAHYRINPATVLKGMNLLVEQDILYKKRGVGMFVRTGAAGQIKEQREAAFFQEYVLRMVQEAKKLGLSEAELLALVEKGMRE